jgi:hypothetical protein
MNSQSGNEEIMESGSGTAGAIRHPRAAPELDQTVGTAPLSRFSAERNRHPRAESRMTVLTSD